MNYPVNYDFGKKWESEIVPLLNNSRLKKSIRDGVNNYLLELNIKKKYKKKTPPSLYNCIDVYYELMERKYNYIIENLKKECKLPKKYLKIEKKINDKNNLFENIKLDRQIFRLENKILKPYKKWKVIGKSIESYILFDGKFWAPTFELTLARLVCPEEDWSVRYGKSHSTVINKDETKCFDIIYWAYNNSNINNLSNNYSKYTNYRIENYIFSYPLTKDVADDITLGGKQAFIDSS